MLGIVIILNVKEDSFSKQVHVFTNKSSDFIISSNFEGEQISTYGITSDNPLATQVGIKILEQGGNAVDAAIAVSFILGVVEPFGSGIGGGGIMLIHPGYGEDPVVYDYRETAPIQMDSNGIGIPGFVKGMYEVHNDFGEMDIQKLIEPSIQFAENGVPVSQSLAERFAFAANRLPPLDHFFPNGKALKKDDILIQTDLAKTLRSIQEKGPSVFYHGYIADSIMRQAGSIDKQDLQSYNVVVKDPLQGKFDEFDVYTPPPPAGGVMLIQTLLLAELLNIEETKTNNSIFTTLMGLINRKSYKDRLHKIGDPTFVDVPMEEMISQEHIDYLASNITNLNLYEEGSLQLDSQADIDDHENTTHFVVVDSNGMMVSATNTLSNFFGSGKYVEGFFLNNQLHNFSNTTNSPNRPEPGKRPYSYISPTILAKDGKPVMGVGSSGGRRITSMIAQTLIKMIKFKEPIQSSIEAPRTFLEIDQDVLTVEKGFIFLEDFVERGLRVEYSNSNSYFGAVQALVIDYQNNKIYGGSDPRRGGSWKSKVED
ncbi:gamma-glutamyltranspeptidase/glutathione hydrolase [Evansella vedderi]|uniref:Glutathione hydrolase proenzyme n=1 Tax=Evansella vedderi TaxID=38282 RepID=A0ABT9ZT35_9BACI|nr:gamma-glutamyltransferase [Evansella vedderi]MDQ0253917.1 gamma-glutamyltranspeptidase/glutathione hydrolase [Evansella vedderi]